MKSILAVDNILDWSSSRYRLSLSWIVFHNRPTHESVAFCHPRGIIHPFAAGTHHCILVAKDQRVWLNVWHIYVCQEKSLGNPYAMKQVPEKCSIYDTGINLSPFTQFISLPTNSALNIIWFWKTSLVTPLWWSNATTALLKVIGLEDGENSSSSIGLGSPFLSTWIPAFYKGFGFPPDVRRCLMELLNFLL